MQDYIINFFVWWYAIKVRNMIITVRRWEAFVLGFTGTASMWQNLSLPLFQDDSTLGRVIGFTIRSLWLVLGGAITLVVTIPVVMLAVVYASLPLLILLQVVVGIFRITIFS